MLFNDRRNTTSNLFNKTFGRRADQKINKEQVEKAYKAKGSEPKPKFYPTNLSGETKPRKNEWK